MNNLKKIRNQKGISPQELCSKLKVSRQYLWYNENVKISLKLAENAADLLNVNVFEILGDDVFLLKPSTQEEKEIVIKNIEG